MAGYKTGWILAAVAVTATTPAGGQEMADVQIRAERLADGVHVLYGRGGNIGVSAGEDGVFLIDDQYAPLTPRILAALAELSDQSVRFVLNTHWHFDHTGGNENLGRRGAVIVAHRNVRKRMTVGQFIDGLDMAVPPTEPGALPVVTFSDSVTFYLNGDTLEAFHVRPAHTDGDAIVRFRAADVVHMGDVFWNGIYPFIDVSSGGSVEGVITAVDGVLASIGPATRVIPGHGPVTDRAGLAAYLGMLTGVRDRVRAMIAEGASEDDVVAAGITAPWDADWGGDGERLVRTFYREYR